MLCSALLVCASCHPPLCTDTLVYRRGDFSFRQDSMDCEASFRRRSSGWTRGVSSLQRLHSIIRPLLGSSLPALAVPLNPLPGNKTEPENVLLYFGIIDFLQVSHLIGFELCGDVDVGTGLCKYGAVQGCKAVLAWLASVACGGLCCACNAASSLLRAGRGALLSCSAATGSW